MSDLKSAVGRRGSLLGSLKAVAWAFFGIRGRGAHEADIARLNPIHLIIAGSTLAAACVTTLILHGRCAAGTAG